jgi:hypothetical protein
MTAPLTPRFTIAALEVMAEVGIRPKDVREDIAKVAGGLSAEALLASCLQGADADREGGWHDYVDAVVAAAGVVVV